MVNGDFDNLWSGIEAANDKDLSRKIRSASAKYDDLMLGYSVVPDEGFGFLLKMITDTRVMRVQGMEHFFLEIGVDFCKYTLIQQKRLLSVLIENVGCMASEIVRHSVGDLIAREYSVDDAIEALTHLAGGGSWERHVAFVGLDVLVVNEPKSSPRYGEIEAKWVALQNSQMR